MRLCIIKINSNINKYFFNVCYNDYEIFIDFRVYWQLQISTVAEQDWIIKSTYHFFLSIAFYI